MHCINKDTHYERIPYVNKGNPHRVKWVKIKCKLCKLKMYITIGAAVKYGVKTFTCKSCKKGDKREINRAIIDVERRRKLINNELRKRV